MYKKEDYANSLSPSAITSVILAKTKREGKQKSVKTTSTEAMFLLFLSACVCPISISARHTQSLHT